MSKKSNMKAIRLGKDAWPGPLQGRREVRGVCVGGCVDGSRLSGNRWAHAHTRGNHLGWICYRNEHVLASREVAIHELAHLVRGDGGCHDALWRETCLELGGSLDSHEVAGKWSKAYHKRTRRKPSGLPSPQPPGDVLIAATPMSTETPADPAANGNRVQVEAPGPGDSSWTSKYGSFTVADIVTLHEDVEHPGRRSQAHANVLGEILEERWEQLGKGEFGRWLASTGLGDSTANRYRTVNRKGNTLLGPDPSNPACPVSATVVVKVAGVTFEVPLPEAWEGKSIQRIAAGPNPEGETAEKPSATEVITRRWATRLEPAAWARDLADPDRPPTLAADHVDALAEMLIDGLRSLRDDGQFPAINDSATGLLAMLDTVLRQHGVTARGVLDTIDIAGAVSEGYLHLRVLSKDLQAAVSIASVAASRARDASSHLVFRVAESQVIVMAGVPGGVRVRVPLRCWYEGPDGSAFTIEAARLRAWLEPVGVAAVDLLGEEDGGVRASSGGHSVHFESFDPQGIEIVPDFKRAELADTEGLASAFAIATRAIGKVRVDIHDGVLLATSPDAVVRIGLHEAGAVNLAVRREDMKSVVGFLRQHQTVHVGMIGCLATIAGPSASLTATTAIDPCPLESFILTPATVEAEVDAVKLVSATRLLGAGCQDPVRGPLRLTFGNHIVMEARRTGSGGKEKVFSQILAAIATLPAPVSVSVRKDVLLKVLQGVTGGVRVGLVEGAGMHHVRISFMKDGHEASVDISEAGPATGVGDAE